jgi:hypothetical protein
MDKGIRPYCNAKFIASLATRVNSREGNTAFRKGIIASVMEEFGTTLASAATHYNHAFINAKAQPELSTLLEGLGRADDKKGGRKPKAKAAPVETTTEEAGVSLGELVGLCGDDVDADEEQQAAAPVEQTLVSEGVKENTCTHTVTINPPALCSVYKKADGTLVAEGLTREQADALVAKAVQAKKAKLEVR